MAIKGKLKQKTGDSTSEILHPETDASIVVYSNTVGSTAVSNVKAALDTIITAGVGVTDVKNGGGTSLVSGSVATVSPSGIGAVAANTAITGATKTKITYDSKGLVTGGADLSASDIPTLTLSKISDAGAAAAKGVATSVSSSSSNNDLATAKAVYDAIDALPEPMVFKGTLGTNGTITTLPTAGTTYEGYTYKVITAGTYASQAAKVGDVFVCNGTSWVLIPAGDDVDDTHRVIKVNGTQLLGSGISTGAVNFKNGGNVTVSGSGNDITLGVASGYSIPSSTQQSAWSAKYDKPSGGIPASDLAESYATTDALATTDAKIKVTNATVSTTGSGNAVTGVSISNGQIVATKGTTFLTSHQSLTNYVTINTSQTITGKKHFTYQAEFGSNEGQPIIVINSDGINSKAPITSIWESGNSYTSATLSSDGNGTSLTVIDHVEGTFPINVQAEYRPSGIKYTSVATGNQTVTLGFPNKGGTIALTSDLTNKLDKLSTKPTAGTYSAVTINSEGQVTAGSQAIKVIKASDTTKTIADVATNGVYFIEDGVTLS